MAARKPKRMRSMRQWFCGAFTSANDGANAVLEPRRGGRVIVFDLETGAELTNAHDGAIRLFAAFGDYLIVCGPTYDEMAGYVVAAVETLEWRDRLHLVRRCGGAIREGDVQVTKAGRSAA